MNTQNFLDDLFDYSHHYNKKVIEQITLHKSIVSEKSIKLINHILNAHQIWNERIVGEANKIAVWEIRDLNQLLQINERNYADSLKILSTQELNKLFKYKTSKGIEFENSVRDILFHVINHSTYHRGQIASDLKANGIEPLSTDYIFYKRES